MQPRTQQLVDAYVEMVEDRLERGWEPTFLTFMFKQLGGTQSYKQKVMHDTLGRVYASISTRYHRRPRSVPADRMSLWLLCPDWPVPKTRKFERDHLLNIALNDGLHYHGLALTPPETRCADPLSSLMYEKQELFCRADSAVHHFVADDITETPDKALRYILKSVTRHRVDSGEITIFPKAASELTTQNLCVTPRMVVERRLKLLQK